MRARYSYTSVHCISGIDLPGDAPPLVVVERPDMKATLQHDADDLCPELDFRRAVAGRMLRVVFQAAEPEPFGTAIERETKAMRERRAAALNGKLALVVETSGDVDVDLSKNHREHEGWVVGLHLFDKTEIGQEHNLAVNTLLAALPMATQLNVSASPVVDGAFCTDDQGKRYLSYAFYGAAASLTVGTRPERLSTVGEHFNLLAGRSDLSRVVKLSAQAASGEGALRVWLAAWTALELFVQKRFKFYESVFTKRLLAGRSDTVTLGHFRRIREIMTDKYRLSDRFGIIAATLLPDSADADLEAFKALKKQRDDVAHGSDVAESDLRGDEIRAILSRYLEADLRYKASA